jgi:hypothetical protein
MQAGAGLGEGTIGDARTSEPSPQSRPKKVSSRHCCDDERMHSRAATKAGSGSRRVRVKACGQSGWRACCAKVSERGCRTGPAGDAGRIHSIEAAMWEDLKKSKNQQLTALIIPLAA